MHRTGTVKMHGAGKAFLNYTAKIVSFEDEYGQSKMKDGQVCKFLAFLTFVLQK